MFLRVLSKQFQLFPHLCNVQACGCKRYYADAQNTQQKCNGRKVKDLLDARAKEFMENLDDENLKRKKDIEYMIKRLRKQRSNWVPAKIETRDWYNLLHQKPDLLHYRKYLQILCIKESKRLYKGEEDEEKLRLLEENEANYDHLYHHSNDRSLQIFMWKKISAMKSEIPVIIDLDFAGQYQPEQSRVVTQMISALRRNAFHPQPLMFNITSCNKNLRLLDFEVADNTLPGGYFHEQHYLDLFPREQLVYLSPNAPQLETFDKDSIYIVGGTDDGCRNNYTFEKAREQGIRCASFPLFIHGRMKYHGNILSIDKSLNIVRSMYYSNSWKSAFRECLSTEEYLLDDEYEFEPKPSTKSSTKFWHRDRV